MDILLKEDVEHLGDKDQLVSVKPGFARNYLLPQGKAVLATPSIKKQIAETLKQRAHKEAKLRDEAEKVVKGLKKKSLTIGAKAGDGGKIFGSVNTIQIAEALAALGVVVDRKKISLKGEIIKNLGSYEAQVEFHKDVVETIPFDVIEE